MKTPNKSKYTKLIIFAAVVLLAGGIAKSKGWIGSPAAIDVVCEPAKRRTIIEKVSASGNIQPEVEVKLSPEVSGELIDIAVEEGDVVKKGQLLCKIRPDYYVSDYQRNEALVNEMRANLENSRAQLLSSQANLTNQEASYLRNQTLYNEKVLAQSDYDLALVQYVQAKQNVLAAEQSVKAAEFSVTSAEASLKQSGVTLAKTTIFSPIDGIISVLSVKKGERVLGTSQFQGTEIMKIADLKTIEAVVDVNENDINRVELGNETDIEIDAFLGKKFLGTVTSIANAATVSASASSTDQVTTFQVKIKIIPDSYKDERQHIKGSPFRPGLSTTVDIHTNKAENVLSVPIQSVTMRGSVSFSDSLLADTFANKSIVFVVDKNRAKMRVVETGIQDDSYIQIIRGLKEGEQVITSPYLAVSKTLTDDEAVRVVTQDELFSAQRKP